MLQASQIKQVAVGAAKEANLGYKKEMDSGCAFPPNTAFLIFLRFVCNIVSVLSVYSACVLYIYI